MSPEKNPARVNLSMRVEPRISRLLKDMADKSGRSMALEAETVLARAFGLGPQNAVNMARHIKGLTFGELLEFAEYVKGADVEPLTAAAKINQWADDILDRNTIQVEK